MNLAVKRAVEHIDKTYDEIKELEAQFKKAQESIELYRELGGNRIMAKMNGRRHKFVNQVELLRAIMNETVELSNKYSEVSEWYDGWRVEHYER